MSIVSVIQNRYEKWGESRVIISPKPRELVGRVKVEVPDVVVKQKQTQPVIDAYAAAKKRDDLVGKTHEQLIEEHDLMLGFEVLSFDDGTDAKAWMEEQNKR